MICLAVKYSLVWRSASGRGGRAGRGDRYTAEFWVEMIRPASGKINRLKEIRTGFSLFIPWRKPQHPSMVIVTGLRNGSQEIKVIHLLVDWINIPREVFPTTRAC